MDAALVLHDALLGEAIRGHGGVIFSKGGDGFAAVFARAGDAVLATVSAQMAFEAQAWPNPLMLRVRMGLHTGEAEERDGNYFGPVVNRAARLMSSADGGHVVLSLSTVEIVRNRLRDGLGLVDVGTRELKGIVRPERVFELTWPGSPPPIVRSDGTGAAGALPRGVSRLIGRAVELDALCDLVASRPLVTLVGVGGAGKTALAVAAAHRLAAAYRDGVRFVDLSTVLSGAAVAGAIADLFGLRAVPGVTMSELVVRSFAHQECLLVLDNCEHVLDATAALAHAILDRAPGVTTLATSREGLGVPGEQLVGVPPLDMADAIELFQVRVAEQQGSIVAGGDRLVSELCARLDGLPLAIELAAARTRSMSLVDLTGRLGERFRVLRGQRRSADRHQTLRAMVAWSYGLLTEREQRVFDRLSVFTGGFTLAAAAAVCASDDVDRDDVDEVVVGLADKSMVVPDPAGRYRLLETLRQFGEERLHDTGRPGVFRDAHVAFFENLVVECHAGLQGRDQPDWLRTLFADWANIRAAFGWATTTGDVSAAARIATHLVWPSQWHDMHEPFAWIHQVAAMPGADANPQWHHILAALAMATWEANRLDDAVTIGVQALETQPADDWNLDYMAEFAIASGAAFTAQFELAQQHVTQAANRARAAGQPYFEAYHVIGAAIIESMPGANAHALDVARRGREIAADVGNPALLAWALATEGVALDQLGQADAGTVLERGLELARDSQATIAALTCRFPLARLWLHEGRTTEAIPLIIEDLRLMRHRVLWLHRSLLGAAVALTITGQPALAAALYGAIDRPSLAPHEGLNSLIEHVRAECTAALGKETFDERAAAGSHLDPQRAAVLAEQALAAHLTSERATN